MVMHARAGPAEEVALIYCGLIQPGGGWGDRHPAVVGREEDGTPRGGHPSACTGCLSACCPPSRSVRPAAARRRPQTPTLLFAPPLRDPPLPSGPRPVFQGLAAGNAAPRASLPRLLVADPPPSLLLACPPPAGACVYLGCKVTDGVRFAGQLSHMMSTLLSANIATEIVRARAAALHATCVGQWRARSVLLGAPSRHAQCEPLPATHPAPPLRPPSCLQATDLEMRCLKGLKWRLGPYCCRPAHHAREW